VSRAEPGRAGLAGTCFGGDAGRDDNRAEELPGPAGLVPSQLSALAGTFFGGDGNGPGSSSVFDLATAYCCSSCSS
jgi:hypothetical protein